MISRLTHKKTKGDRTTDLLKMQDQIYPWIKLAEQGADSGPRKEYVLDMPTKPFLADLMIFFVLDEADHFKILQTDHMPEGMTLDILYSIAVHNLSRDVEFRLVPTNFGGYGILAGGDHEAGALCLDALWEDCADNIGESLIVAVPAKDVVFMVGRSQTEALEKMKQAAADILRNGNRTLTSHLFLYDAEKKEFSLFE